MLTVFQENISYFEDQVDEKSSKLLAKEDKMVSRRERLLKLKDKMRNLSKSLNKWRAQNATDEDFLVGNGAALALQKTEFLERIFTFTWDREMLVFDRAGADV